MQTFLPYASFTKSAKSLDRQRLGKQRVEAYQIALALTNPRYGWQNHPAVNMWRGYTNSLLIYGMTICDEWISRGYKDTVRNKLAALYDRSVSSSEPPWLGNEQFHVSHQSNLIRKSPEQYKKQWPDVTPDLEYVWPK